jgi:lantibiotic biosynthesis protein
VGGGRVDDRLGGKVLRYLIRMATRPTPYGLFAGVALADFGPRTDLALAPRPSRRHSRPDMGWLMNFAAGLESRPEVRRHLRFVANPCARIRAGRLVLEERLPRKTDEPKAEVSVRATGAVCKALTLARVPIAYVELRDRLGEATGAEQAKVEKLLADLWEQTLLLTDLVPSFTITEPARRLAERLRCIDEARESYSALSSLLEELSAWDDLEPDLALPAYRQLAGRAEALAENEKQPSLQVDMWLRLQGRQLSGAVAEEVARAAELLLRLSPSPHGPPGLKARRRAFTARYNEGREVPLLELLDPAAGPGPPGAAADPANAGGHRSSRRNQVLLDLACHALRTRARVLELDDRILAELETWLPDAATAPPSLDLYALVGARSPSAIDAGEFQVVVGPNIGAIGAGRNLGRFAYFLGDDATRRLTIIARAEETATPGVLAAELVYGPRRFRWANVIVRPAIRRYEIHLGGRSPDGDATAIPLDELVVGMRAGRFYLRWPAADKEIRITSGHMLNTVDAPDIARFLSDVGQDGRPQLTGFHWGVAEGFPFLPRVQSGRVVLRPAEWRIGPADKRRHFVSASPAGLCDDLARWREFGDVPHHVFLVQADNRLVLDLEDAAQADELLHEIRQLGEGGSLLLQEVLPSFDQAWVEGPGGHYFSEIVVPLVPTAPVSIAREKPQQKADHPGTRTTTAIGEPAGLSSALKPPGSDWLYLKIYSGETVHNDLIAGPLRDFSAFVRSERLAASWFFIRYADPYPHLRVRFHGEAGILTAKLLPAICEWAARLMAEGYCSRFAFDTYDREVDRYGGEQGISLAESVFAADSAAVIEFKALTFRKLVSFDDETLGVISVDNLLTGLGFSPSDRIAWLRDLVSWRAEVGAEYRKWQTILRSRLWWARGPDDGETEGPLKAALSAARRALAPAAERLADLDRHSALSRPAAEPYRSFVHLHCNRLFGAIPGAERTVLGLLLRTSESLREFPPSP